MSWFGSKCLVNVCDGQREEFNDRNMSVLCNAHKTDQKYKIMKYNVPNGDRIKWKELSVHFQTSIKYMAEQRVVSRLFLHHCILGYWLCKGQFLAVTAVFVICHRNKTVFYALYNKKKLLRRGRTSYRSPENTSTAFENAAVVIVFGQTLKVKNRKVAAAGLWVWNQRNGVQENGQLDKSIIHKGSYCVMQGRMFILRKYLNEMMTEHFENICKILVSVSLNSEFETNWPAIYVTTVVWPFFGKSLLILQCTVCKTVF